MNFKTTALIVLLTLSGCVKEYYNHGYSFDSDSISSIAVGKSSYDDVIDALGSPTSESTYGVKTVYYISNKTEKTAFLDPKVVEQRVLEINFDSKGIASNINEYSTADRNKIDFASDETSIEGNRVILLEQILGNVGKYNKKQKAF